MDKHLAELYDPDKIPSDLLTAYETLDKAVEDACGVDFNGDEEKIVAHFFKLYASITKSPQNELWNTSKPKLLFSIKDSAQ